MSKSAAMQDVIQASTLANLPWLIHGFSTREGGATTVYRSGRGELNLGFTPDDDRSTVLANRERLLSRLTGVPQGPAYGLVTIRQTHSATVRRVDRLHLSADGVAGTLEGDGLITNEPGGLLGILTADCVPVLVVDTRRGVVAAFHAGWRGTVQAIVEKGVAKMQDEFGTAPEDLLAAVGPAIGACCYNVGQEVREKFLDTFVNGQTLFSAVDADSSEGEPRDRHSRFRLDLAEANRRQLLASGVPQGAITMIDACTSCQNGQFFSHRAEQGRTGRMMAVVGIRHL